jgi:uncharacterized protein DUF2721
MTIETIIRTISLILAPTVMITSCMLFLNGLFARYEHITARMRAMHRERLDLFQALSPVGSSALQRKIVLGGQRIVEIEQQLPKMLRRHKLVRNAVVVIGTAIVIFVLSMFIIALATLTNSSLTAEIALLAFLTGTGALLVGVLFTTWELSQSHLEVVYEIEHGLSLKREELMQEEAADAAGPEKNG